MEHIIDMVDEVCQKWNKDLPVIPIPAQVHECYHYEIKNTRRKMEDKHVMLQDMNTLFDLKVQVLMANLINTITRPQNKATDFCYYVIIQRTFHSCLSLNTIKR